jgi:formamidopyrimidine-DNA glycosylase
MPELPEVETIRRHLEQVLPGRTIEAVSHLDSRLVKHSALPYEAMRSRLPGLTVSGVEREGKFLLVRFVTGEGLVLHLGMSGRLVIVERARPYAPHTHLALAVGSEEVRLIDPRRFGRVAWSTGLCLPGVTLGIDPLSDAFGAGTLLNLFKGRRVALKTALLNQRLIAGLGNIYADEALYAARLSPGRSAGSLRQAEAQVLAEAIKAVLRESLEHRGTSFSDYVDALGHPGSNQDYLKVYGRASQPCPRCGTMIARVVIGGRSSHYCPCCQPAYRDGQGDRDHYGLCEGETHRAEV